jgi:hypothetical protein
VIAALVIISIIISTIAYFIFRPGNAFSVIGIAVSSIAVALIGVNIAMYVSTTSTEKLNGQVTSKEQVTVSCSHSYQCNCRTVTSGSGKNKTTSTVCDTCYEHLHDYDWEVNSNVGSITIERVDRQGVYEPQRWSQVQVGEPVAVDHNYTNWIKPAHSSLFHLQDLDEKQIAMLPKYPGQIYDYYRLNRIVTDGHVNIPNVDQMNEYLSEQLRTIGPARQANIIFVITDKPSLQFATDTYAAWQGAEKNDIVVFVSLDGNNIRWTDIQAWSKDSIFQVKLRDAINDQHIFNMKNIIDVTAQNTMQYYKRKPMKEFEYLKNDIQTVTPFDASIIIVLMLILNGVGFRLATANNSYNYRRPSRRY